MFLLERFIHPFLVSSFNSKTLLYHFWGPLHFLGSSPLFRHLHIWGCPHFFGQNVIVPYHILMQISSSTKNNTNLASRATHSLPVTPHGLQNPKWQPVGPKMPDGVWKGVHPYVLRAPDNFCQKVFLIQELPLGEKYITEKKIV